PADDREVPSGIVALRPFEVDVLHARVAARRVRARPQDVRRAQVAVAQGEALEGGDLVLDPGHPGQRRLEERLEAVLGQERAVPFRHTPTSASTSASSCGVPTGTAAHGSGPELTGPRPGAGTEWRRARRRAWERR